MTPEFEKWLVEYIKEGPQLPEYGNMVGAMKYGILAIFAEIEREAHLIAIEHGLEGEWEIFMDMAIERIKAKFGLSQPLPEPPKGGEGDATKED